ncbi:MAG: hypothetical protein IJZ18_00995, partial [Mailhella sp.]|nr:hypothetical protein [Mailhella sp.]
MLTKGAIGNLVNRYRAVLKKCNLINTFGSLAVASMLVLGGAGVAGATVFEGNVPSQFKKGSVTLGENGYTVVDGVHTLNGNISWSGHSSSSVNQDYLDTNLNGNKLIIKNTEGIHGAIYAGGKYEYTGADYKVSGNLPGVNIVGGDG